jgi:uncharacterized protein (TIGR03437 family)
MRFPLSFCILLIGIGAQAQIRVTDVVNAASRIPTGRFSSGIAQGAVFVVTGRDLGPDELQSASFPLPAADGLAGVTVQIAADGTTFDGILVYVSKNEVAAILPSATPLGAAVVTVNNNGATASKAITVVASAFGIFKQRKALYPSSAIAFRVVPGEDESTVIDLNNEEQSLRPGQEVIINGTGLGAISSDETQSGVTDVPATELKVFAGVKQAEVDSAGRGLCCDGLDEEFPIPRGIAAWDVIRFKVPEGVLGCFIPVVVQTGNFVSNIATISIAEDGGACTPPASGLPPEVTAALVDKIGVSIGNVDLSRSTSFAMTAAGVLNTTRRDTGSAAFVRYPDLPASLIGIEYPRAVNTCAINGYPDANGGVSINGDSFPVVPLRPVALDAGGPLAVSGPSGSRNIVKRTVGMIFDYPSANFGNGSPGNYYDPGHYTVSGPGGRDIAVFKAETDFPAEPFVWTNSPKASPWLVERAKDLTIEWTGGTPDSLVVFTGTNFVAGVTTTFQCAARVSDGRFTIPSYVLLSVSPSGNIPMGGFGVENTTVNVFKASGLDVSTIRYSNGYSVTARFQ